MNPISTRKQLKEIDLTQQNNFPLFIHELSVKKFREIKDLTIRLNHPVSVLSGTNKIGKTSLLSMLACSHVEFQMRSNTTGIFERCTWSRLVKFSNHDIQNEDWEYSIKFKNGNKVETKIGRRLLATKKWSGVAKRESQIGNKKVIFIDLDRISPARSFSNMLFLNTQRSLDEISLNSRIREYFSYVFEEEFKLSIIAKYQNKESYIFNNSFSSFNSASGEDVVLAILIDAVNVDKKALVLIDELELGLHPKIQRRLVDVILDISKVDHKQFIVTTHSPSLLSSFDKESRIFIQRSSDNLTNYRSISRISIPAAFSKMDSEIYPLVNIFCEDEISKRLITAAFDYIKTTQPDIQKIVNIIPVGAASDVKKVLEVQNKIYDSLKIKTGYICVFDGDQRQIFNNENPRHVTFLFSNSAPEYFLLQSYLEKNKNQALAYHLKNSPAHALFSKCIEHNISHNPEGVFNSLYLEIKDTKDYANWLEDFKNFIINECIFFSEQYD